MSAPAGQGRTPANRAPRSADRDRRIAEARERRAPRQPAVREIDGPPGPEPTRYGDWEKGGRCSDF